MKSTNYRVPQYAVFSSHLSLHPSSVQILSPVPYFQTLQIRVLPLMWDQTFTISQNMKKKQKTFVYFNLNDFRWQAESRKILNCIVARIPPIWPTFNFFVIAILICYHSSQICKLLHHIFKQFTFTFSLQYKSSYSVQFKPNCYLSDLQFKG